ncbi:hypothetical protein L228DRAFT_265632 [Xylona heveae TC161]|uniref:Zn(2)-C6 fungal-type domain-containing protein n=1 Tax=Xylona heveae (strain CBS 132557 / TC161) TaxID=1328760 RepID=A0A165INL8_XYLHT|nr:hypothetical protein L228DRAFT_265632 [Xylona heveae TC161]KZF25158.1 hypothetical protein L228DRAFT_265632 [Xylona heveae TC161]
MSRSSTGCWTCKLRHRRCDQLRPACRECSERHISCHGYGPKPAWINNKSLLNAELSRIKHAVKENFRQNSRRRAARTNESSNDQETHRDGSFPTNSDATEASKACSDSAAVSPAQQLTFQESQLLIHYLDYIFPLQFPYYVDNPEVGGRGWLFWFLMKSDPLHQAILTLSALHRYTRFARRAGDTEQELIEYHTKALQGLRQALCQHEIGDLATSSEQLIEFLACGSALISFEVFQGGTMNWQPHLDALSSVVNGMTHVSNHLSSRAQSRPPFTASPGTEDMEHAQRFLVANLLWFDLLASTSSGTAPKIAYKLWLDERNIDLSQLMGCYNWVMTAIGDIASIKSRGASENSTAVVEAFEIKDRLEAGLRDLDLVAQVPMPIAVPISRVFACSAMVELYTTCPPLVYTASAMQDAVANVIEAIRLFPENTSLRGLTWPVCVAGSMAEGDQQQYFETVMQKMLGGSGIGFTNCDTVSQIVKRCWHYRRNHPGQSWNWNDSMGAMGICALLV